MSWDLELSEVCGEEAIFEGSAELGVCEDEIDDG